MPHAAFSPESLDDQDVAAARGLGRKGRMFWPFLMLAAFVTIAILSAQAGNDLDLLEGNGRRDPFVIQNILYPYAAAAFFATFMPALLGKMAASDRTTFGAAIGFGFGAVCGMFMSFASAFSWFGLEPGGYTEFSFSGLADVPMLVVYALITGTFIGFPTTFLGLFGALSGGLVRRVFVAADPLFSDDFGDE